MRACPLCNSKDIKWSDKDYTGAKIQICRNCNMFYQDLNAEKDLQEEYYNEEEHFSDIDLTEKNDYEKLLSKNQIYKNYSQKNNFIKKFGLTNGRLLDIGFGTGEFMYFMDQKGWEVSGTEIVDETVNKIKEVTNWDVKCAKSPAGKFNKKFDLISLLAVIEHVEEPLNLLLEAKKLLKNDGLILITTPNFGSLTNKMKFLQSKWKLKSRPYRYLSAFHHVNYFTLDTLKRILAEAGFELKLNQTRYKEKYDTWWGTLYEKVLNKYNLSWTFEIYASKSQ